MRKGFTITGLDLQQQILPYSYNRAPSRALLYITGLRPVIVIRTSNYWCSWVGAAHLPYPCVLVLGLEAQNRCREESFLLRINFYLCAGAHKN